MMNLELFPGFLKVGCFTFGGAYSAIPLIMDVVLSSGWLTREELTHMIAVSESTPGPIMVNLATYVGSSQGGLPGALLATLAVVLPSFLIILLIAKVLGRALTNRYVQALLSGVKPAIVGIIAGTGLWMTLECCLPRLSGAPADPAAPVIALVLAGATLLSRRRRKKPLSPVALILLSALLGLVLYG